MGRGMVCYALSFTLFDRFLDVTEAFRSNLDIKYKRCTQSTLTLSSIVHKQSMRSRHFARSGLYGKEQFDILAIIEIC